MGSAGWAGVAIGALGAVLAIDLGGFTRGLSNLLREARASFGSFFVAMPTTPWGLRVVGVGLIVVGACVVVSGGAA
jgi:hypothetical protein